MDWKVFVNQDPRMAGMYEKVRHKPAWPMLTALACFGLVVVVPVVLAILAGLVVGLVVYTLGSVVAGIAGWFQGLIGGGDRPAVMPGDDLRENVRVVQR